MLCLKNIKIIGLLKDLIQFEKISLKSKYNTSRKKINNLINFKINLNTM